MRKNDEPIVAMTTRMPKSLHDRLKKVADGRMINKFVLRFVEEGLRRMDRKK